jgi:methionine sulfoxide reductase heme-binding subunit
MASGRAAEAAPGGGVGEGLKRELGAPPAVENTAAAPVPRHRSAARRIKPPRWLPAFVFAASLVPFIWVALAFASDAFRGTRILGSNPIKEAEHFTGHWTLRFLMLSLCVSPLIHFSRQGWLIRYRRTLGLFAFFYACVHLTIYFVLDVELMWSDLVADVMDRTYITLGMLGLLLLVPLAVTSTKASIRRLGNRRWNRLHQLVFATVVLGCIHFYMGVKRDVTEPLVYAAIFALLIGWRLREWKRAASAKPPVAAA